MLVTGCWLVASGLWLLDGVYRVLDEYFIELIGLIELIGSMSPQHDEGLIFQVRHYNQSSCGFMICGTDCLSEINHST